MNTNGINNFEILKKAFQKHYHIRLECLEETMIENEIKEAICDYYFSEYYDNLKQYCSIYTPNSIIIPLKDVYNNYENINQIIKTFPNGYVFSRLDTASTKPTHPYTNIEDILENMKQSERTMNHIKDMEHNLVLREWIDLTNYYELRCFIEDKKLRAISGTTVFHHIPSKKIKKILQKISEDISIFCDYSSFVLDIAIPIYNELDTTKYYIIEINTPTWLCATSGLFDLTVPYDIHLLTEEYNNELFTYPEMRILFENNIVEI